MFILISLSSNKTALLNYIIVQFIKSNLTERLSDTNVDIKSIPWMLYLNIFCVHNLLYQMFFVPVNER